MEADNFMFDTPGEPSEPNNFVRAQGLVSMALDSFHDRFGLPRLAMDDEALGEYLTTRLSFIMEELGEVAKEVNSGNMDAAIIEMADLLFVVEGTFHTMGLRGDQALFAVIRKNQAKDPTQYQYSTVNGKLIRRTDV